MHRGPGQPARLGQAVVSCYVDDLIAELCRRLHEAFPGVEGQSVREAKVLGAEQVGAPVDPHDHGQVGSRGFVQCRHRHVDVEEQTVFRGGLVPGRGEDGRAVVGRVAAVAGLGAVWNLCGVDLKAGSAITRGWQEDLCRVGHDIWRLGWPKARGAAGESD